MCKFFSFVTRGDGKAVFFDAAAREALLESNQEDYIPDSHTSIVHKFISTISADEDMCNKYEYSAGQLIVYQLNTIDDSKKIKKWIAKFAKSAEFKNICEKAVMQNGYTLSDVPEHLKTPELCEKAVMQNGCALVYVPEHLKTLELCEKAYKNM